MAMTIVERDRAITGGVDTHLDVHVAAVLDPVGGLLGAESFEVNARGYRALLRWMGSFGAVHKVGVEGIGAYGAGLGAPRLGPEVPGLHGASHQGRPLEARGDPHPEALRSQGGLPPTPSPLRSPRTEPGPGDTWQL